MTIPFTKALVFGEKKNLQEQTVIRNISTQRTKVFNYLRLQ